ncbi:hypothetical protein EII17_08950 [Clostridiales bacterium COT073_COT-073]|nr:hypothetical protein EII17_08950 [Clostridiales bacterium COT073_COT-073]
MKKTIIFIVFMLITLVSCQKTEDTSPKTEELSKEEKIGFGASISNGKNSYSLSLEDSYQLQYELLNAHEVIVDLEKAKQVDENKNFTIYLFPKESQPGNTAKTYVVWAEQERYYVVNLNILSDTVFVLHPYYSPTIKGILEKNN